MSKAELTKRLGRLLGFEDGAEDVLDHLLSIESSKDLQDYLSQLLGRDDEDVQHFVKDVFFFQNGKAITSSEPIEEPSSSIKVNGPTQQLQKPGEKGKDQETKSKGVQPTNELSNTGPSTSGRGRSKKQSDAASKHQANAIASLVGRNKTPPRKTSTNKISVVTPPKKKPPPSSSSADERHDKQQESTTGESAKIQQQQQLQRMRVKAHPPKGKAKIVCGCFGNLHKALTNCLYCGRISCAKEGYGYCPACGMLVEEVKVNNPTDPAFKHKERLLSFDRDFARRTVVVDDQGDFFSMESSTWMTEQERSEASERHAERDQKLHTRQKQTLNIAF